jgi:hypothetical protein
MSGVPRDRVLRVYDEGVDAFAAAAGGFVLEAWERPACGEWMATQLARDVLAVVEWYHDWLDRAERGDAAPPLGVAELATQNEAALVGLAELSGPESVERFAARARLYRGRVASH